MVGFSFPLLKTASGIFSLAAFITSSPPASSSVSAPEKACCVYDIASGSTVWTKFDPLGLAVGDRYKTLDDAALAGGVDAFAAANSDSGVEKGIQFARYADGSYTYGEIQTGSEVDPHGSGVDINSEIIPEGSTALKRSNLHTHPTDNSEGEVVKSALDIFSDMDLGEQEFGDRNVDFKKVPIEYEGIDIQRGKYVVNPNGDLWKTKRTVPLDDDAYNNGFGGTPEQKKQWERNPSIEKINNVVKPIEKPKDEPEDEN